MNWAFGSLSLPDLPGVVILNNVLPQRVISNYKSSPKVGKDGGVNYDHVVGTFDATYVLVISQQIGAKTMLYIILAALFGCVGVIWLYTQRPHRSGKRLPGPTGLPM